MHIIYICAILYFRYKNNFFVFFFFVYIPKNLNVLYKIKHTIKLKPYI